MHFSLLISRLPAGMAEGAGTRRMRDELTGALADLDDRHSRPVQRIGRPAQGPLPLGAAYVPAVTAASAFGDAGPRLRGARELVACRNLRVLYHHSKLFKKDYGRWPSTVAELDGYVDFAVASQFASPFGLKTEVSSAGLFPSSRLTEEKGGRRRSRRMTTRSDDSFCMKSTGPRAIGNSNSGPISSREYSTIYVDKEGEIHRVPKKEEKKAAAAVSVEKAVGSISKRYNQNKFQI